MEKEQLSKSNNNVREHVMKYYGSMFEKPEIKKTDIKKSKRFKKRNFIKKKKKIENIKLQKKNSEKQISETDYQKSFREIDLEYKTESENMIKIINKDLEKKFENNFLNFIDKPEKLLEADNNEKEVFECLKNIEELTNSNYNKNKNIFIDFEKINFLINNKENGIENNLKKNKIEKKIFETFKKIDTEENIKKNSLKIITKQFEYQSEKKKNSKKHFVNKEKHVNFQSPQNEINNFVNSPKNNQNEKNLNFKKDFSNKKYSLRSSEPFDEKLLIKSDILEMVENNKFEHQKNLLDESIDKKILFDTDEKFYLEDDDQIEEEVYQKNNFENFDKLLNRHKEMEFCPKKQNFKKKNNFQKTNINELLKKVKSKENFKKNLKILQKEEELDFDTFKKQFSFKDTKDIITEINKIYQKTQLESKVEEITKEDYKTAGSLVRETYNNDPNLIKNENYIDESFEVIERDIYNKKFENVQKSAGFKNSKKTDFHKKRNVQNLIKKKNLDLFNKNKNFQDYKKEVINKNAYFSEKTNKNSKKSLFSYEYLSLNPDLISMNLDEEELFRNKLNILVAKMMNKKVALIQRFWKMKKFKENFKSKGTTLERIFKAFLGFRRESEDFGGGRNHGFSYDERFFNGKVEKKFFGFLEHEKEFGDEVGLVLRDVENKTKNIIS